MSIILHPAFLQIMFAAAVSAYILRIPIVHIGGGEKTSGSIDEGFRHSISKLSNLHFPITEIYKKRLIQLGENPKTVFNIGSLNITKIKNNNYLSKAKLEKKLNIKFYKKNLNGFHSCFFFGGSYLKITLTKYV